jgi:hypothetical protein
MKKLTEVLEDIAIGIGFLALLGLIGFGADSLKKAIYPVEKTINYTTEIGKVQYNSGTGQQ